VIPGRRNPAAVRRVMTLLLLLSCLSSLQSQEVYPGKTWTLAPGFSTAFLQPLASGTSGGGLGMSLTAEDLFPRVRFGFSGGYNYLLREGNGLLPFPSFSLQGGYRFPLSSLLSLYPVAEFSLLWPADETGFTLSSALSAGAAADLHLYKRNYLTLDAQLVFPFSKNIPPYLSFQMGIKHTIPFMVAVPPVGLKLRVEPDYFSPDGDGEADLLEIRMDLTNSRSVKKWEINIFDQKQTELFSLSGQGTPPPQCYWDGYSSSHELVSSASDYSVRATTWDILGNPETRTRPFVTDVFVYKEGGKLKIRVPSILFPPGSADFTQLSVEERNRNRDIIVRIAATLRKFPEYRILIEGHGNLIHWESPEMADREQEEELVPLSRARALEVRRVLIDEGIPWKRLDVAGQGGSSPIVPFGDEQNRWKNRRVEFILLK
jgi:outer membrane protein OmpA-like peptidoglycan-associated protein